MKKVIGLLLVLAVSFSAYYGDKALTRNIIEVNGNAETYVTSTQIPSWVYIQPQGIAVRIDPQGKDSSKGILVTDGTLFKSDVLGIGQKISIKSTTITGNVFMYRSVYGAY